MTFLFKSKTDAGMTIEKVVREYFDYSNILWPHKEDTEKKLQRLLVKVSECFPHVEEILTSMTKDPEKIKVGTKGVLQLLEKNDFPTDYIVSFKKIRGLGGDEFIELLDKELFISNMLGGDNKTEYFNALINQHSNFVAKDVERIMAEYHNFFGSPSVIIPFINTVTDLRDKLSTDHLIDLVKHLYTSEPWDKEVSEELFTLLGSLEGFGEERRVNILKKEFDLFDLIHDKKDRKKSKFYELSKDGNKICIEFTTLRQAAANYSYGLFIPMVGYLNEIYELSKSLSGINTGVHHHLLRLDSVVGFNDVKNNTSVDITLGKYSVMTRNVPEDQIKKALEDFKSVEKYINYFIHGLDAINSATTDALSGLGYSARYMSDGFVCVAEENDVNITPWMGERLNLINLRIPYGLIENKNSFLTGLGAYKNVSTIIKPEYYEITIEKPKKYTEVLGFIDSFIGKKLPSPWASNVDSIMFLNENVRQDVLDKVLDLDCQTLASFKGLYMRVDYFKQCFYDLDPDKKENIVKVIYSLKPEVRCKEIEDWLTEKYSDLVDRVGREFLEGE